MRFKIERLGSALNMQQNLTESCATCGEDQKCRRRDFSEQAWAALLLWGEVQKKSVDQAICEHCYNELRETLIDRADEIETAASAPAPRTKSVPAAKPAVAQAPAASRGKVRKAG